MNLRTFNNVKECRRRKVSMALLTELRISSGLRVRHGCRSGCLVAEPCVVYRRIQAARLHGESRDGRKLVASSEQYCQASTDSVATDIDSLSLRLACNRNVDKQPQPQLLNARTTNILAFRITRIYFHKLRRF